MSRRNFRCRPFHCDSTHRRRSGAPRRNGRLFHPSPDIPSPPSILGFEPGTQRQLANYDESESYFRKLDAASDRMNLYQDPTPPTARHEVLELLFEVGDVQSLHETVADKVDVLRGPRSTSTDAASSPSGTPTATGRC